MYLRGLTSGAHFNIHHIFPRDWCKKHGIKPAVYDSIINKTPLSYKTNRIIGGSAPSEYLAKLEKGSAHAGDSGGHSRRLPCDAHDLAQVAPG